MQKWTVTDIADRFEEAVKTLRRLPPVKAQGYFSTWPQIRRTAEELLHAEKELVRRGPPSAEAVSRMEETLDWIFYLDSEDERRLVWLRAERVRWKEICWRIGCGRTKAWQLWVMALLKIVTRLNEQGVSEMFEQKNTTQREHISAYCYIYSRELPLTDALAQFPTDFPSLSMPVHGAHLYRVRP